jgi:hypothetical protein
MLNLDYKYEIITKRMIKEKKANIMEKKLKKCYSKI